MPKFTANLSMLFQEHPFLERFKAASESGFQYVEYLFPYEWPAEQIANQLRDHNLKQILFNLPPGYWAEGERGIACLPDRKTEFREGVAQALDYAGTLGVRKLHCMSGIADPTIESNTLHETYLENLLFASEACAKNGVELLIEPINSRIDMPGYFLDNLPMALNICEQLSQKNLRIQYDIYHMQIMHGDLIRTLTEHLDLIGHIQFADNPGRHEPGTGEINFPRVFEQLDQLNYQGWVGAEYLPSNNTQESLSWRN